MQRLAVPFLAPIRVGNVIEVCEVERVIYNDGGWIEGAVPTTTPLLRDVASGVVFCAPELASWVEHRPLGLRSPGGGHRARPDVRQARVLACVVGSRGSDSAEAIVTLLDLEPLLAPQTPYR